MLTVRTVKFLPPGFSLHHVYGLQGENALCHELGSKRFIVDPRVRLEFDLNLIEGLFGHPRFAEGLAVVLLPSTPPIEREKIIARLTNKCLLMYVGVKATAENIIIRAKQLMDEKGAIVQRMMQNPSNCFTIMQKAAPREGADIVAPPSDPGQQQFETTITAISRLLFQVVGEPIIILRKNWTDRTVNVLISQGEEEKTLTLWAFLQLILAMSEDGRLPRTTGQEIRTLLRPLIK